MPTSSPTVEMDDAATVPVPTLREINPETDTTTRELAPVAQSISYARLVVLSTNYAGREFELDKPAMVIGRTDDNDVWINHRSISRHHAKIVRENGRYAIVDLQSSNGVRVNGEEYGKVELRRADVIDLGHVRMRFVEAGEDFLFGRDAQAIELEPERGSRMLLWALLALVVVAAGAGLFYMLERESASADSTTSGPTSAGTTARPPEAETRVAQPPPAPADAGRVEPAPDELPTAGVAEHLKAAEEAIKAEKWAAAHDEATKALELEPTSARAQDLARQAKGELGEELKYDEFERCPKSNYRCIIDAFQKIDPLSVYRDKAKPRWDQARDQFIRERVAVARKLAVKGKCDDLDRMAASSGAYWPEAEDAVAAVRCTKVSATAAVKPEVVDDRRPEGTEDEGEAAAPSAEDEKEAEAVLKEAQAAAKASQYGKALRLCEKALSLKKTQDATVVCAIASCNLRADPKAKKYIGRIRSGTTKSMARQVCLRNGVTVPP
jgi:hypothetical protein